MNAIKYKLAAFVCLFWFCVYRTCIGGSVFGPLMFMVLIVQDLRIDLIQDNLDDRSQLDPKE